MNGPEHYATAEQCLWHLEQTYAGDPAETVLIARAQVHATLALAAAIAGDIWGKAQAVKSS